MVPQGCDPARKKRCGRAPDTANKKGTQPAPVASFGTNNLSTSAGKAFAPQGHPPFKKKRRLSKSAKAAKAEAQAAAKAAAVVAAKAAEEAAAKEASMTKFKL
ncbi:hypothetical protein AWZ03_015364 [Drosophila navojoa]|uniref:Uncharacterized protein n=1 Tax=Drosophila navojoa TaxID=7232 RepID=A0A484ANA8_DRONA|nr:hypothetical protein AWZ03_015364 [Drosophila navojoa]